MSHHEEAEAHDTSPSEESRHTSRAKDPSIVREGQKPIRSLAKFFFFAAAFFVVLAIAFKLRSYYYHQKAEAENREKAQQASILVAQQAAREKTARLENASEEDFDRRLRFERVTPASFNVDFPAIIAWVGPGGIRVKYPGATEFVPYVAGNFTPPKGAKKMGTYEFAPADPKNPATVKVFEKVWR